MIIKNLYLVLGALCAILAIFACKKADSPTLVYQTLVKSAEKCDIEGLKATFTKESRDFLESMVKMAQSIGGAEAQDTWKGMCEDFKKAEEVVKEEIKGDTAELTVKEGAEEVKMPFRKEEGRWKIDLMTMMKSAFEEMKEMPVVTPPVGEQPEAQPEKVQPPMPPTEAPTQEGRPEGAVEAPPGGGRNAPTPPM